MSALAVERSRKARHSLKDSTFPSRLRRLRLQQGLNVFNTAAEVRCSTTTFGNWQSGDTTPHFFQAPRLAQALGLPVAQLFTDELVLAEIRVSDATLEGIRKQGRDECRRVAQRLALSLESRLWEEATRPPVDVSPGARPKPRRSRAEVLAGLRERYGKPTSS